MPTQYFFPPEITASVDFYLMCHIIKNNQGIERLQHLVMLGCVCLVIERPAMQCLAGGPCKIDYGTLLNGSECAFVLA